MSNVDALVKDFLEQRCIAVAGVSARRETPANLIYRTLRSRGFNVFAISPASAEIDGERCYPDIDSLPQKPDGIVIVTKPAFAEDLVRQCVRAGVRRVWLHNVLGTRPRLMKSVSAKVSSVSPAAVELCRSNGISVIPGSCPMQFIGDFGHKCLRGLLRITGALEVPA